MKKVTHIMMKEHFCVARLPKEVKPCLALSVVYSKYLGHDTSQDVA